MLDPRYPPASRRPEEPGRRKRFRVENFHLVVTALLAGAATFLVYWIVAKFFVG